ncbi:MAG: Peptidase [Chloroflexi bacterium]|nr:Peptidase [Chloroflexota bacterium]
MKRFVSSLRLSLLVILAVSGAALNPAQSAAAGPGNERGEINLEDRAEKGADLARARTTGDVSSVRLVVVYSTESDVNDPVRNVVRRESGARLLTASQTLRRDVLRVQDGDAGVVAARVRRLPGVIDAYPDSVVHKSAETTPWGLTKIGAPTAWVASQGAGIKVAVLDCGIHKAHPDIGAGKVALEIDYTLSPYGADDRCNHGTHVAGTIAALTNNGTGVSSVAPSVSFLNGKVLSDSGSGWFSDIESGIKWAADNGAKVISMSLGAFTSCPASTAAATNYAWGKGVVIVAAAGNDGRLGESAPANCPNVIGVAATDSADAKASFSNYGTNVELAAPGVSVYSTVNPDINSAEYAYFNGTSMATPHVSGVAALIWATSFGTSASAVRQRLYDTADKISGTGSSWKYGRVNAFQAVGGSSLPPSPDFSLSMAPSSVTVTAGAPAAYTVNMNRTGGFTGLVSWSIGGLPTGASGSFNPNPASGNSSTLTVTTTAATPPGSNVFTVTGTSGSLIHTKTATLVVNAPPVLPAISINDASRTERNSGTRSLSFAVSLSKSSTQTVTLNYATANGTTNPATGGTTCGSGVDYLTKAGALSFSPGQTSRTISVSICGDGLVEPSETFFVNLTGASINATIGDGQGIGTILNDD